MVGRRLLYNYYRSKNSRQKLHVPVLFADECGDNGPATFARLSAPKGLVVDKSGRLYFVDGNRIRTVDPTTRNVQTFAGSLVLSGTRPLPCTGTISLDQVNI